MDWIEIRDKETNEVWFYNPTTGISQWDKPNSMEPYSMAIYSFLRFLKNLLTIYL